MTEFDHDSASLPMMDDLPPVQPPSAGFIVQLFLFPALIVMGVVAIWWMFGMIAVGEQDWRKLVSELQSQNLLIRNRAMYGLAQVLDQDSRRGDQGQKLRSNREIAQGLTDQLVIELRSNSTSKEGVAIQEFLTRALGMMDSLDVIAPALESAMEPQRDLDVRKCAIVSLSYVAGRAWERGQPLSNTQCVEALVRISADPQPVMRQSAAFALGLFDSAEATHQLEVLLESNDLMTGINAAIGLARQGSTRGFSVLRTALSTSTIENTPETAQEFGDQFRIVKNSLKAVADLAPKFDDQQKNELIPHVEELAAKHPEMRIRIDATAALNALNALKNAP